MTRRIDGVDQNTGPHSRAYQTMVARTSAEAMPALRAHWDLSKRHASLMAILLQPGTRLRGGQAARFVLLILTALSRRAAQFRGEPSKKVLKKLCAGWYEKVLCRCLDYTPKAQSGARERIKFSD